MSGFALSHDIAQHKVRGILFDHLPTTLLAERLFAQMQTIRVIEHLDARKKITGTEIHPVPITDETTLAELFASYVQHGLIINGVKRRPLPYPFQVNAIQGTITIHRAGRGRRVFPIAQCIEASTGEVRSYGVGNALFWRDNVIITLLFNESSRTNAARLASQLDTIAAKLVEIRSDPALMAVLARKKPLRQAQAPVDFYQRPDRPAPPTNKDVQRASTLRRTLDT